MWAACCRRLTPVAFSERHAPLTNVGLPSPLKSAKTLDLVALPVGIPICRRERSPKGSESAIRPRFVQDSFLALTTARAFVALLSHCGTKISA
jgi:hypothetical protein